MLLFTNYLTYFLLQDSDHSLSTKKPAPLPLFNAADIIQVVPSYSMPFGMHWRDNQCDGQFVRKALGMAQVKPHYVFFYFHMLHIWIHNTVLVCVAQVSENTCDSRRGRISSSPCTQLEKLVSVVVECRTVELSHALGFMHIVCSVLSTYLIFIPRACLTSSMWQAPKLSYDFLIMKHLFPRISLQV